MLQWIHKDMALWCSGAIRSAAVEDSRAPPRCGWNAGLDVPAEFLAHVSPLGWEHINLTGEYRWPGARPRST